MNYSFSDPSCGLNRYNNWVPQGCFPGANDLNRRLARPVDYTVQSNVWCEPEPRRGVGILGVFAALAGIAVVASFLRKPSEEITIVKHTKKSVATTPKAADPAVADPNKGKTQPIAPKITTTPKGATVEENSDYTVITKKNAKVTLATDKAGAGTVGDFDVNGKDDFVVNGPLHHYNADNANDPDNGQTCGLYIENGKELRPIADPNDQKFKTKNGDPLNFGVNNGIMGQDANGNFFVMTYAEWNAKKISDPTLASGAKWAMQNGGILLDKDAKGTSINSHNQASTNKAIRSAMGYNAAGELIVITTKKEVTFYELGELMRKAGAVEAMYLDGAGKNDQGQRVGISGHIINDGSNKVNGYLTDGRPLFHIQ